MLKQTLIIPAPLEAARASTHHPTVRSGAAAAMDSQQHPCERQAPATRGAFKRPLLLLSMVTMVLGGTAGPLFTRMYFVHGGTRLWLTSLLQACGFPILFLPLSVSYLRRRGRVGAAGLFSVTRRAAAACVALGGLTSLGSYAYACGSSSLPVSTTSLLNSTQLAFTAGFAFFLLGQRFTAYSLNAVVLLVMGPIVLSLQAAGDRPLGESSRRYHLGFFLMLVAAALIGTFTPLVELTYRSMKQKVTYAVVTEMQMVISVSACAFCTVAMLMNKDFQAIPMEAKEYGLGETKYYLVLLACAVFWQLMNVGSVGVISCSSALLAGVMAAMLVVVGQLIPVLVLHEKFNGGKAVALALSLWGFVSYLYGEHKSEREQLLPTAEAKSAPPRASPSSDSGQASTCLRYQPPPLLVDESGEDKSRNPIKYARIVN